MDSLLVRDPLRRATVHSALSDTWIRNEIEDLKALYRLRIVAQL